MNEDIQAPALSKRIESQVRQFVIGNLDRLKSSRGSCCIEVNVTGDERRHDAIRLIPGVTQTIVDELRQRGVHAVATGETFRIGRFENEVTLPPAPKDRGDVLVLNIEPS